MPLLQREGRHQRDAQQALLFPPTTMLDQSQQIIARSDDFQYPARAGIAPSSVLPPLNAVSPDTLSVVALGDDQLASRLIQQAGLA